MMEKFVRDMVSRFPALKPALDEHIKSQNGTILSHIFFWEVVNHVLSLVRSGNPEALDETGELLKYLEDNYLEGDEHYTVRNLIQVSFLEDIQYEEELTEKIVEMLGPKLKALWMSEGYRSREI